MKKILLTLIVILSASKLQASELTIVSTGGAYGKSQYEAYHKPYMKKTGVKIKQEFYNGNVAEMKAQVEAGNVTWDIVDVELSDAIRACDEGLLEKIDLSTLPNGSDGTDAKDDFLPGTLHECAVATIIWSTIFAYDKTKFTTPPKTFADFFNTKKFPGMRGLRKVAKSNLEFALVADGVPAKDVYKVLATKAGIDRAFAKLDKIKQDIIWWEAGSQPPQLLADGEVIMSTAYNGRIFDAAIKENKPFEIVWDGQVWDLELWVIPKGGKNVEQAMDFVRFSTASEQLARQASFISYGPARKSSANLVGKFHNKDIEMAIHMPTHKENIKNAIQSDPEFWADNNEHLEQRFQSWLNN